MQGRRLLSQELLSHALVAEAALLLVAVERLALAALVAAVQALLLPYQVRRALRTLAAAEAAVLTMAGIKLAVQADQVWSLSPCQQPNILV